MLRPRLLLPKSVKLRWPLARLLLCFNACRVAQTKETAKGQLAYQLDINQVPAADDAKASSEERKAAAGSAGSAAAGSASSAGSAGADTTAATSGAAATVSAGAGVEPPAAL